MLGCFQFKATFKWMSVLGAWINTEICEQILLKRSFPPPPGILLDLVNIGEEKCYFQFVVQVEGLLPGIDTSSMS